MIYATLTDLQARLPADELLEVADRDASGMVDGDAVNAALTDASEEIDSYLRGRYDLPLPTNPPVLIGICCVLARHRLHVHARPEHMEKDYDRAIKTLRDYASGMASLDIGGTEAPAEPGIVTLISEDRIFNRKSMRDY